MADELSAAVERLRTSTQRLNAAVDAAGQLVRDIESFLEEAHVGIETGVQYQTYDNPKKKLRLHWCLEYRRFESGKFRIAIVHRDGHDSSEITVRAWSESSREDKIESVKKLPELLVALAKEVERRAEHAEKTVSSVAGQLPPLKKRKGGA